MLTARPLQVAIASPVNNFFPLCVSPLRTLTQSAAVIRHRLAHPAVPDVQLPRRTGPGPPLHVLGDQSAPRARTADRLTCHRRGSDWPEQ